MKLERHSFQGKFCITGYPRTSTEFEEWEQFFGNNVRIIGFLTFEVEEK